MKLIDEINSKKNDDKARIYQRFFKTGKGEYGEGDKFLGLTVPEQREIAKRHADADFDDIKELIYSEFHEHRAVGFFILAYKYEKSDETGRKKIVDFYLEHKWQGNNWDLVDCIADKILGKYLIDKDKSTLYGLAESENLWDRRISIISTFEFIKNNKFEDTLKISKILLKDMHDLIHKAVGWMLREVGKRDQNILEKFLKENYDYIPRTTLRYAIERFDKEKRENFLKKKF